MKIALIGNMNNMFFTLTRYLRDAGYDAELLLLENEYGHFLPDADTFANDYRQYVKTLSWGDRKKFRGTRKTQIQSSLEMYDKIICCDVVPAFLHKAGLRADIFVPHGSDLFGYPFQNLRDYVKLDLNQIHFAHMQLKGILDAKEIFWGEKGNQLNRIIKKLGVEHKTRFVPVPMVYTPEYSDGKIQGIKDRSSIFPLFQRLRSENDIIVFHHARQFWKFKARLPWNQKKVEYHYKGNDYLIRAFARFVKNNDTIHSVLILFEYGLDVSHSKKLISDLGIERYVRWFPIMPRKEILLGISMSDIGTGEYIGGWYSAGVVYENLALGKPLLHYCSLDDQDLYPFINVKNEEEIFQALQNYNDDPERFKELGKRGAVWYQKNIVDVALNEYIRVLST
jgi:hypothetical protein